MKLVIFDLDGTLAQSKQPLTPKMAAHLSKLLAETRVAIISGGALEQFLKQIVSKLPPETDFTNLYLLPTSGAALYEFNSDAWQKIYEERLSEKERESIEDAMRKAVEESGIVNFSDKSWGDRMEYRGGQVSFSALGQLAPVALKSEWDPDKSKRRALLSAIERHLPKGFTATMGGMTTIDVVRTGIDKAYGIRKLCERLGLAESDALYVGDELVAGGNDEAVYKTDAKPIRVADPADTMKLIERLTA